MSLSRREALKVITWTTAALALGVPLPGCEPGRSLPHIPLGTDITPGKEIIPPDTVIPKAIEYWQRIAASWGRTYCI